MTTEDLFRIDDVYLVLVASENPGDAMKKLRALISDQRTWTERCEVETACRDLLVIEHFKIRSRRET